jgi:hypothetical protein
VRWPAPGGPNGFALSPDEKVLYVTETETARPWSYKILSPGELEAFPYPSPNGGRIVYGAGGFHRFDGMKVEADGHICVATLQNGGITIGSPADGFAEHIPMPDRLTTNLCFAGPDLRTVHVTLFMSRFRRAVSWPGSNGRDPVIPSTSSTGWTEWTDADGGISPAEGKGIFRPANRKTHRKSFPVNARRIETAAGPPRSRPRSETRGAGPRCRTLIFSMRSGRQRRPHGHKKSNPTDRADT